MYSFTMNGGWIVECTLQCLSIAMGGCRVANDVNLWFLWSSMGSFSRMWICLENI